MYFDVMDPKEQNIIDPDTGEVLGSLERPRIRLKIIHVQDNLAVASTYISKHINLGGDVFINPALGLGPFARALMPPNWVTKYETLQKTGKTPNDLDEEDRAIKTGDPVVQVLEIDEPEHDNTNEN
ncbi:hypothetical protein C6497_07130 [Candidatus Poribacteria bacterium]|nr:MAG: hypothetical protein C6497_07130 [Candidatus Poribacteria bacterium]